MTCVIVPVSPSYSLCFVVENDLVFLLEAHALTFRWHA